MKKYNPILLLMLGLFVRVNGADFSCQITPRPGETFTTARFDLRLLDGVENPRLILLLLPGFESDGAWLLDDSFWHEFAVRHRAVLMAGSFKAIPKEEREVGLNYNLADKGSGRALLDALHQLEEQADLEGLSRLPLLMWGHSAGGQFNYGFACFRPEQVLGYCAIKGGYYPMEPLPETYQVPSLYLAGENDKPRRVGGLQDIFKQLSQNGTNPIAFATEPGSGHGVALCNLLIKPFFDGIIALRLPDENPVPFTEMKAFQNGQGVRVSTGEDLPAAWLPDKRTLKIYRQFIGGEFRLPSTQGDAPKTIGEN